MNGRVRGALAVLLLAVAASAVAGCAARALETTVSGDVEVAPDRPTRIVVRYVIPAGGERLTDLTASFLLANQDDPRIAASTSGGLVGGGGSGSGGEIRVPGDACANGCMIEAAADISWVGPAEAPLRLGWTGVLSRTFEAPGPSGTPPPIDAPVVEATVLAGAAPQIPRLAWLGVGYGLAALTVVVWWRRGTGLRRLRLGLVLTGPVVVVGSWLWLLLHEYSRAAYIPMAAGLLVVAGLVLAYGAALTRFRHGGGWALPAIGAFHLFGLGGVLAVGVWLAGTYRPVELVLLGVVALLPGAAAVSARAITKAIPPPESTDPAEAGPTAIETD